MKKYFILAFLLLISYVGYKYVLKDKTNVIIPQTTDKIDSSQYSQCTSDSDCIFAIDPNGGCPIGINKKYANYYEETCEGINHYLSGNSCSKVTSGSKCYWNLMGCPGAPRVGCIQGVCKAAPCGGPK